MQMKQTLMRFCKPVVAGSLTAAAPLLFFTIIFAAFSLPDGINGPGSIGPALYLAILPLLVTLPIVLVASLLIGLPLTLFLRRTGRESTFAYCTGGAIAGLLIPLVALLLMGAPSGHWTAFLGLIGGIVTACVWSRDGRPIPPPDT